MKNYQLKALSIHVNGRVYFKEEGFIFNEKNTNPNDLRNIVEAGFLVEVDGKEIEKQLKEAEAKAKAEAEAKAIAETEAKAKEKAEAKAKAEAEAEAEAKAKAEAEAKAKAEADKKTKNKK